MWAVLFSSLVGDGINELLFLLSLWFGILNHQPEGNTANLNPLVFRAPL